MTERFIFSLSVYLLFISIFLFLFSFQFFSFPVVLALPLPSPSSQTPYYASLFYKETEKMCLRNILTNEISDQRQGFFLNSNYYYLKCKFFSCLDFPHQPEATAGKKNQDV